MALSIFSNQSAHNSHRYFASSSANVVDSLTKLSSGRRVMHARDDAASLTIGSRLNAEARSLSVATTNVSQANSMLQIADGAMATVNTMLVRMKHLAVQGSSSSLSATERSFVFDEFNSVRSEIDRIANDTEYNGTKLLSGTRHSSTDAADFATGGTAADLNALKGFSGFKFATDAPNVKDGDNFKLDYNATTATFTVTNTTSGQRQSIDFAFSNDRAALLPLARLVQPRLPASGSEINFGLAAQEIRSGTGFTPLQQSIYQAGLTAQEAALANLGLTTDDFYTRLTRTQQEDISAIGINALFKAAAAHVPRPADRTTRDLNFSEFGLTVTLNDALDGTATVNTNNSFGVSQSVRDTSLTYRIGTGAKADEDAMQLTLGQTNINSLNPELGRIQNFTNYRDAENAIANVSRAIDALQSSRANIGTSQNRLHFTQQNLRNTMESNDGARSTLMDLDMASEMTTFTARRILLRSGISMLSQANQMPGNLMRLLL